MAGVSATRVVKFLLVISLDPRSPLSPFLLIKNIKQGRLRIVWKRYSTELCIATWHLGVTVFIIHEQNPTLR